MDAVTLLSEAFNVSGPQAGVWEAGRLVRVVGDVSIAAEDTLIIEPGVEVRFLGYHSIDVFGTMLATGEENDSIVFTSGQPNPAPNDWETILFWNHTSSGSIISYCKIQFGYIGIICYENAAPVISNNLIKWNNGIGIRCVYSSSPTIQYNSISNNNSDGIYCHHFSSPSIQNNTIINSNGHGINCDYSCSPSIQYNTISFNNSNGISCSKSSPSIFKNTIIHNNQNGIYCPNPSSPIIQNNNILQNNSSGIHSNYLTGYVNSMPYILNNIIAGNYLGIFLSTDHQTFSNNIFWNNTILSGGSAVPPEFGNVVTQNTNGDPCDTYFNLFMDPEFVDYANGDFNLLVTSPCIDAGNPDTAYYDPDGTIVDIGAYYFDQGSAAPVISDFTADPVSGRQPLVVQFTNAITGPVTEYTWSFGDGTTSNQPNPVHVYTAMGTYDVSLLVTGPGGSDTKVKANYITVNAPLPPLVAKFTAEPLLGYAPLEVQFTNESTGPWQTVLWDFGDGNTDTVSNPLHTYQEPGFYTVSLSIFTGTSYPSDQTSQIHVVGWCNFARAKLWSN